jgi:ArsR family transcriptional regulator, arsenate/arsenite/antimonite-responsive transcriptional repressor
MKQFVKIAKALADRNRIRVLLALQEGELCICQITELLDLAASTTSRHVAILKNAGLVEDRKSGRWVYCRLPGKSAPWEAKKSIRWIVDLFSQEPEIKRDRKRLQKILQLTPEDLCKKQRIKKKSN